jgi:phosphoribosyl-ATP pyrophosphohydrolase/phosphoribosyl-AMP cyclohydrolase
MAARTLAILAPAMAPTNPDPQIAYDSRGLVPVVVQDAGTGEVLTLAYANAEAIERTRETGEAHFYSRSRAELWHKGATSGNTLAVRRIRVDCDADAVLYLVDPKGPACHTGERTCFHAGETAPVPAEAFAHLDRNAAAPDPAGYTAKLLADPPFIAEKVLEEAEEVTRAAREESDERVAEEAADVLYHLSVLLASRDLSLADAYEVLNARRR